MASPSHMLAVFGPLHNPVDTIPLFRGEAHEFSWYNVVEDWDISVDDASNSIYTCGTSPVHGQTKFTLVCPHCYILGCPEPKLNKPFQETRSHRGRLNQYLTETVSHRSVSNLAVHHANCICAGTSSGSTTTVPSLRMNPPRYFFGRRAIEQNVRFEIIVALRSITTNPQDIANGIENELRSHCSTNLVGESTVTHRPSHGDIRISGRLDSIPTARFNILATSDQGESVRFHFSFPPLPGITVWQVHNREEFRFALEQKSEGGHDVWQLSLNPLSSREVRLLLSEDCFNQLRDAFGAHFEDLFSSAKQLSGNPEYASRMLRTSEADLHWMMLTNEAIFKQQDLKLKSRNTPALAIIPIDDHFDDVTHLFLIRSDTTCDITLRLTPYGRGLSRVENRQFKLTGQEHANEILFPHMAGIEQLPQVRFNEVQAGRNNVYGLRITGASELQVRFEDEPIHFEPVEGAPCDQVDITNVDLPDGDPELLSTIAQHLLNLSSGVKVPEGWDLPSECLFSALSLMADMLRHRFTDLLPGPPSDPSEGVGKSQLTRMANALECLPGLPSPKSRENSGPLERLMDGQFMWDYHAVGDKGEEDEDDDFTSFFSSMEERHTGIFRYAPEGCGYLPLEGSSLALLIDHRSVAQLQHAFAGLNVDHLHLVSTGHRLIDVEHADDIGMNQVEDLPPLLRLPKHPVTLLNSCFESDELFVHSDWDGWRTDWFDIEEAQPKVSIHAEGLRKAPPRGNGWESEGGRPLQATSANGTEIHRFYLQRLVRLPNDDLEEHEVPEFMRPFNTAYLLQRTSWLNKVQQPSQRVVLFQPSFDSDFVPWPFQNRHAALPRSGSLLRFHRFDALRDVLRAFFAASGVYERLPQGGLHLLPFHLKALVNGHDNSSVYNAIAEVDPAAASALANHVRSRAWIPSEE